MHTHTTRWVYTAAAGRHGLVLCNSHNACRSDETLVLLLKLTSSSLHWPTAGITKAIKLSIAIIRIAKADAV